MNANLIPISNYLIEDAGPENQQYWQGRSAMGTKYEEVVVGQGDTAKEAFQDALDELHDLNYDVQAIPDNPNELDLKACLDLDQRNHGEFSYYVVIYVR